MSTIVTRASLTRPLTYNEVDANFTNLNNDKAELSALAASSGSSMVGFIQAGTGAVVRNIRDKARDILNVFDFMTAAQIADVQAGTLLLDVTTPVQNAINACLAAGRNWLLVPAGKYRVSSQFIISGSLRLIGEGSAYTANANFPASKGTTFSWYGGSTTVFAFSAVNYGFGMEGIYIDCRGLASNGLIVSDCVGGKFDDVVIRNYTTRGLHLRSTLTYPLNTNSWHTFTNLTVESVESGVSEQIRCGGVTGGGNACHVVFNNTRVTHGGAAHGIVLGGCDNVTFLMTFIYRAPAGTGYGVTIDASEVTNFPMSNYFYHLQAGEGGYYQATWPGGTYQTSHIYGYAIDNGQPAISAPAGSVFAVYGDGSVHGAKNIGKSRGNNLHFSISYTAGAANRVFNLPTAEPNANYRVILIPTQQLSLVYWVTDITASSFRVNWPSDPGGTVVFDVVIVRI